jgi:hypothetical protein
MSPSSPSFPFSPNLSNPYVCQAVAEQLFVCHDCWFCRNGLPQKVCASDGGIYAHISKQSASASYVSIVYFVVALLSMFAVRQAKNLRSRPGWSNGTIYGVQKWVLYSQGMTASRIMTIGCTLTLIKYHHDRHSIHVLQSRRAPPGATCFFPEATCLKVL